MMTTHVLLLLGVFTAASPSTHINLSKHMQILFTITRVPLIVKKNPAIFPILERTKFICQNIPVPARIFITLYNW